MSSTPTNNANANSGPQSRRVAGGTRNDARNNNENKKKEKFTGAAKGMKAVLMMPSERQKGTSANFANFKAELAIYVGMEVSDDIGRVWASEYLAQYDEKWEPEYPTKPTDADDTKAMSQYRSKVTAYEENWATKWPAAKLTIWNAILGQCTPKLRGHLAKLEFYDDAVKTKNCIKLLEVANVISGGGQILGFEPQARANALIELVHCKQRGLTVEEYSNEFKARYAAYKNLGGTLENKGDTWTNGVGTKTTTNQAQLVCLFLASANQE